MASSSPSIATKSVLLLPPKPKLGFGRRPSCSCSPIGPTRAFPNPRTGPSVPNRPRWPWFCRAASPGPPPSPGGPPSSEDPVQAMQAVVSNIQDRVRIFFAVFFWMSLFFWGSAWDGRDSSRNNKDPWSRK